MTIITADGRKIEFCGDDGGRISVDRRSADRRVIDRIVPEQRGKDRRQPAPPAPRPAVVQNTRQRISSSVSKQDIDKRIMAGLDRLFELADKKFLSDREAVQALSTEATLMFAKSSPCWMTKEEVDAAELSRAANAGA
jgi:hypothetical protein